MNHYLALLSDVKQNGSYREDRTGVGAFSVFGRQFRHDMRSGFPLLTTKRVAFRWVAEELFWFLSGSTRESDLSSRNVDIWKEWADLDHTSKFGRDAGDLGPIYGRLWRGFPVGYIGEDSAPFEIDQIAQLYEDLEKTPNSRRLIVSGWHPYYQKRVALPPCHTLWQLDVDTDNSLSLSLYARSIDIFLGLPFNIASYALLLKLIAVTTGREARDLIISFGNLHLYSNHVEQAELQLSREPYALPTVEIDQKLWNTGLSGLLGATYNDIKLRNYIHHPKIEAQVAI